ncbi:MAG: L-asparaginase 1 [Dethiosulfovibrio peptidovorans]|nr:MAG: L-asparaginase 1 [Dethiosulfovibrio peptidovorans]
MQRLAVIFTGGTIVSALGAEGRTGPDQRASQEVHELVEGIFQDQDVVVVSREPWGVPGLDSSELTPVHWVELARTVAFELREGATGVLILHGTDTMAYTSAWLSLCFPQLNVPVVLTGSQLTLDFMPEDVTVNLRGAAQVVCADVPGVWIYCNWKLIPGDRAHKAHSQYPDAYTAVNGQPLYFNPEWGRRGQGLSIRKPGSMELSHFSKRAINTDLQKVQEIVRGVGWVFCAPGVVPSLRGDERILAVVGYGLGNCHSGVLQELRTVFANAPKPHVVACSQAEGGMKNPGGYADVGLASLAASGFPVWGQMNYPLEFIHALGCYALLASPEAPGFILSRFLREWGAERLHL